MNFTHGLLRTSRTIFQYSSDLRLPNSTTPQLNRSSAILHGWTSYSSDLGLPNSTTPQLNRSSAILHGWTSEIATVLNNYRNRPFGGDDVPVKDMDPMGITRIVKIGIRHGEVIDAIFVYFERNGTVQSTDRWGGNGGGLTVINLKAHEYITSVKGYFNEDYYGQKVVSSLTVETNWAVYGPYGTGEGQSFELSAVDSQIIGFHARTGQYVNAIGVYVKRIIRRKSVLCGGSGGLPKDIDHMGFPRIVKVSIHHGDAIDALSVRYDLEVGTTERTSLWGGNTGVLTEINLKPNEYIKSVRGYVGYFGNLFIVRSLQLITNLESYGPYGKEEGTPFELSAPGGRIIGFYGCSGAYLDAIGVYIMLPSNVDRLAMI